MSLMHDIYKTESLTHYVELVFVTKIMINQGTPPPYNLPFLFLPKNWKASSHVTLYALFLYFILIGKYVYIARKIKNYKKVCKQSLPPTAPPVWLGPASTPSR